MKRFFQKLLGFFGVRTNANLLSPAEFTDAVAAHLREKAPNVPLEVVGPLELKVTTQADGDANVFLENAYQLYQANPENQEAIIKTYAQACLETANRQKQVLDVNRILPVIKDVGFLEQVKATAAARGHDSGKLNPVSEPYNSELAIVYAEDTASNIRYFPLDDLKEANVDVKDLRRLAMENLRFLLPNIKVSGGEGCYMVTAGGDYEASLLLLDSLWTGGQMPVDGDYVVAVPARDVLLVAGSRDEKSLEKLRELAAQVFGEATYRLTPKLFVYRQGRFEVFSDL